MSYKLDSTTKIYPWVKAFMSVSISQFPQVYNKLDFPIELSHRVQKIAHDFAFTYVAMMNNPDHATSLKRLLDNSESASIHMLKGLSTTASYAEKRAALFTNAFSYLDEIGCADDIYQWCKNTRAYFKLMDSRKNQEIQSLDACFHLMRKWAVLDWLEKLKSDENVQDNADWKPLIEEYSPIYLRQSPPQFTNKILKRLVLSEDVNTTLREIVLNHETLKFQLVTTMNQIMAASRTLWDDFALRNWGADTWIRLEGQYRLNQNVWRKIGNTLSQENMNQLKQWIGQHKDDFIGLSLPLPEIIP